MKYELAKELKDAGFPQKSYGNGLLPEGGCPHWMTEEHGKCDCFAYPPTLEELIDACGDDFSHVVRFMVGKEVRYRAFPPIDGINLFPSRDSEGYSTPSEAVARLWLVLNKKDVQSD